MNKQKTSNKLTMLCSMCGKIETIAKEVDSVHHEMLNKTAFDMIDIIRSMQAEIENDAERIYIIGDFDKSDMIEELFKKHGAFVVKNKKFVSDGIYYIGTDKNIHKAGIKGSGGDELLRNTGYKEIKLDK